MKIGVFDSGFGGLTVLKAFTQILPEYDFVYLGDSARAPYGNHSHEVIFEYVKEAVQYLFNQDCQLVILACNTASAQALPKLQQTWLKEHYPDRRVLGVIRPIAEAVVALSDENSKVGVIGTRATVTSNAYQKEIHKLSNDLQVVQKACPLLVPLIEEGFAKRPETKKILKYYLRPLRQQGITHLIQGCTHYPLLQSITKSFMGNSVNVLPVSDIVAYSLKDYLARHKEMNSLLSKNKKVEFCTTDKHDQFDALASLFYGKKVEAKMVDLTK